MTTLSPSLPRRALLVLVLGLTLARAAPELRAAEKLPDGARVTKLEAVPARISLGTPYEYAQVVVTGHLASGEKLDVTRVVQLEKPANIAISPTGLVQPVADGSGVLKIGLMGQSLSIPVRVSGQKVKHPVSFVRDVMPVLARVGCNAGTCHGAQEGKNGFKLSLRGYDPIFDHRALTDDLEGRRINRAAPDTSLMLMKPSGAAPHVGGALIKPGERYYELLRDWIADGVKADFGSPRVASIDVQPKGAVIPLPGMKQQVVVYATYGDGKVRDVTAEAFIESSNTEVATTDRQGTVTAVRRGEATVMARYEGAYAAAPLFIMGQRSGFAWKEVPEFNYIDTLVYEKLRQVKVLPSDVCTDAEFLRRLYLDLTGLPPAPAQVRAFVADQRSTRVKRDELVDKLIGSPDFIEHWTNKWADLLQVNRKFLGEQGAAALRTFIRKAVADNMPYDQLVHTILTDSGSNLDHPAASYFKILRDPGSAMENTTQLFLAVRFNCNKCHDHPFERWTQDQYYQLSAFFAQVSRTEDPRYKGQRVGGSAVEGATPLVEIIGDQKTGDVTHIRTGAVTRPTFPFRHRDLAPTTASRREQLAHWITSKENAYFARSYVNRLWSYLLGVGLIEPVDDIRAGNPPTNPKLLDRLSNDFVASGFNVRHMLATICKSRVYQHSVVANAWNQDDETNYARAVARRLPAEVLYDAIQRATGSMSHLPGLPAGARAVQLLDSAQDVPGGFLDLFGKPPRESACECERTGSMMLGPVLNLVNGPVVGEAVKDPNNRIAKLLMAEKDSSKVIDELYLAVLCRLPTAKERAAALKALHDGEPDYHAVVEEAKRRAEALAAYEKKLPALQSKWEEDLKQQAPWAPLEIVSVASKNGTILTKQADGSILASGKNPDKEIYTVTARTKLAGVTGFRIQVLPDRKLPKRGPGRGNNGNLVLSEFKVALHGEDETKPVPVGLDKAQASFSQDGYGVANAIDNNAGTGWGLAPQTGRAQTAVFQAKSPGSFSYGALLQFTLEQEQLKGHNIGKFRLSVTTAKPPLTLDGLSEALAKAVHVDPALRTPEQKTLLTQTYQSSNTELARLRQGVADYPMPIDKRQLGAQDLVWALINSKAFQFNH